MSRCRFANLIGVGQVCCVRSAGSPSLTGICFTLQDRIGTLQSAAAEGRAAKEALLTQSAAAVKSTECQRQLAAQVEAAHAENCSLRHQGEQMASELECLKEKHRQATAEVQAIQARIEKATAEHKVRRPRCSSPSNMHRV